MRNTAIRLPSPPYGSAEIQQLHARGARRIVRDTVDLLGKYGNVAPRAGSWTTPPEIDAAILDELDFYGRDYYQKHPIPAV
jgi:hypothetical protein